MKDAINQFSTVTEVEDFLSGLPESEKIFFLVEFLQMKETAKEEIFKFSLAYLEGFNQTQVGRYLFLIMDLKKSLNQEVRDRAERILDKAPIKDLAEKFSVLLSLVNSDYNFLGQEATRLIEKINSRLLSGHFDYLHTILETGSVPAIMTVVKMVLAGIISSWSEKEKESHFFILDKIRITQSGNLKEEAESAMLCVLDKKWEDGQLICDYWSFLIASVKSEDVMMSEMAAFTTWKVLENASLEIRKANLDHLVYCSHSLSSFLGNLFEPLTIKTLTELEVQASEQYVEFLFEVLMSKDKKNRTAAWRLLLQINPDNLPLDYLLNLRGSEIYRLRKSSKKLLQKISDDQLAKNLAKLINSQRSVSYRTRESGYYLAMRVKTAKKVNETDFLRENLRSQNRNVSNLAKKLLS